MKTLLTTAALALAFLAAPAAEARVAKHQDKPHASATVKAKAAKTGKKAGAKAKHKKPSKKGSHKTGR